MNNYLTIDLLAKALDNWGQHQHVNPADNYQLLFLETGSINIQLGKKNYTISDQAVLFIAPGQHLQVVQKSSSIKGWSIRFDTDYFLLCLKNQVKLCFYPFFQLNQQAVLQVSSKKWHLLIDIIQKLNYEQSGRTKLNDDLLCRLYLNILLIELERLYHLEQLAAAHDGSRQGLLAAQFKQLVEQHFKSIRKVTEYAKKLFISPTYLNDTVKEVLGCSASKFIQDRIILEIKSQLIQTEATISQIAFDLGYADVSYFCRFFKKHTGKSPQNYRHSNHFPIQ